MTKVTERKIYWTVLIFAVLSIIFAISASGQSGEFDTMTLRDNDGSKEIRQRSSIEIKGGILRMAENGQEWDEPILFQSKGPYYQEHPVMVIDTTAGRYTLFLDRMTITRAYLGSNIGADRIYSNQD